MRGLYLDALAYEPSSVAELKQLYSLGQISDGEVKDLLYNRIIEILDPIRMNRAQYEQADIRDFVMSGAAIAQERCRKVVSELKEKMFLQFPE